MLPAGEAAGFWARLRGAGVMPCGLGARDTLRLEAGMNLYGSDMDETVSPLESGPRLDHRLGAAGPRLHRPRRARRRRRRAACRASRSGLLLADRAVLRSHQKVIVPAVGEGEVTSGTFSPTLERSIGLARVPSQTDRSL